LGREEKVKPCSAPGRGSRYTYHDPNGDLHTRKAVRLLGIVGGTGAVKHGPNILPVSPKTEQAGAACSDCQAGSLSIFYLDELRKYSGNDGDGIRWNKQRRC